VKAIFPREGVKLSPASTYYERVHGDIDKLLERELDRIKGIYYAGDSIPQYWLSFGPDEIAAYCGGKLKWNENSNINTNWSEPFVDDWATALPLKLQADNPLWQRMLEFYRRAANVFSGRVLLMPLDFHTNMDLLLSIRGAERLCMDTMDSPELIDRAMLDARSIFHKVWTAVLEAGRMKQFGYAFDGYSPDESVSVLACDFSCMISPDMFRRWVKPAIEDEASVVDHVIYHWDGPRALIHFNDLMSIKKIHTISYVPDPFENHTRYIDLYKRVQKAGKSESVIGTVDEIKFMHTELDPAKTMYNPWVNSVKEMDDLLVWFVKNT
jgi:hypothetical protein